MPLPRRKFMQIAAAAATVAALPVSASALDYPTRAVRLVVGFAAGGAPDIVARIIGQYLSDRLGQPFVIEDRPGAGTNLATEAVVRAAPDGYTLLFMALPGSVSSPILYGNTGFNVARDIAAVASINTNPFVMVVDPSFPAKTVPEFIAYAKANPGKINMASGGTGSPLHVAGELFKMMAGVNMIHVPYRSEALALPDLIGGQVQIMFGVMPASLGYVRSGKLRALAVTSAKRQPELPDVPALSEFLPGYEANGWYGVSAPKDTPPQIIETLNKQINAALADPKVRQHLTELGCGVFAGSPADFEKFIVSETDKWAKVVQFAGVKAD